MSHQAAALPEILKTPPVLEGPIDFGGLDEQVLVHVERRPPLAWFIAFASTSTVMIVGMALISYTLATGVGVWGNNIPLLGLRYHQLRLLGGNRACRHPDLRNPPALPGTVAERHFAVRRGHDYLCGHVRRPVPYDSRRQTWIAFWLFPYPNQRAIWPNFRSPLIWDVFAISTYFAVSLLFWYLGLVPDLASLRDRTKGIIRRFIYSVLSIGWRGSTSHWRHYEKAYLIIAGLATGLVLSVHSVVSFDFAVSLVPGWHMTIFPPISWSAPSLQVSPWWSWRWWWSGSPCAWGTSSPCTTSTS